MDLVGRTLKWQRMAVAAAVILAAVGFWRGAYDVFNTFKATTVALALIALVALSAYRVSRTRRAILPDTLAWWPLGGFAIALVVATLASNRPLFSVVGNPGRHDGLAMYLVYALLFAAAIRLYRDHSPKRLLAAILIGAVPVAGYGLLQAFGTDPFQWNTVEGGPPVFSTFGNADFFSAWLGIIVPLCAWAALTRSLSGTARALSAVLGIVCFVASVESGSLQGPLLAVAGTAVVVGVWLFSTDGAAARYRRSLLGAGALLGVVAVGLVGAGIGPLAGVQDSAARSMETRIGKWETALTMFSERPVTGVGLDTFGDWFHRYRPTSLAAESGLERTVDNPHNLFLAMLSNGGLLLAVAYTAVVAVIAWALVRGLRHSSGEQRLLLGGLGGAWLAYQAQSLVSIDVPPLAVMNWVLGGLIVAVGTKPELKVRALPGAPALTSNKPGKRNKHKQPRKKTPVVATNPALVGAIGLLTAAAVWFTVIPLRADVATAEAVQLAANDQTQAAVAAYERASNLAPWESRYPSLLGEYLAEADNEEAALAAHEAALAREPRGLSHAINVGRFAARTDNPERSAKAYQRALEIDPKTPKVLAEVGRSELRRDEPQRAAELLERAVRLKDGRAQWWVALGRARRATDDTSGARQAFQRALDIDPQAEGAEKALERLA
jgi:O-antigen ligase/Flp pilus assembly protein TadD